MSTRTVDDFREQFDPTFVVNNPRVVMKRALRPTKVFLVTAAQNATPVHDRWWGILQQIAEHRKAELLVVPLRYKNPTSKWSGSQQNAEWWAPEVRDYLWNVRHKLNKHVEVLGDFKIQPTASSPLTGSEALSGVESAIIGHTKLQMRCIPTPSSRMAKIMTTTGACTEANYTDSRAGRVGEFHHSLSAVIVEVDGNRFHLRHIHYDAKSCTATDLGVCYTTNGYGRATRPLALVMGDTHVDAIDPQVREATFGAGGIVATLKPERLIWHDLLDGYSCNPHHYGNPFIAVAKRRTNTDRVRDELNRAIKFVADHTPKGCESLIVSSNHDDFLNRWLRNTDWRDDPTNAEFYLETALAVVRGSKKDGSGTQSPDVMALYLERFEKLKPPMRVLRRDESVVLGGVEVGMHGDRGPNGSRGSIRNLRRIGTKSIIGHTHAPGIDEGCYQVGTSTRLNLEYTSGPSSWLNTHCVLHADGKRQLVNIIDGRWKA